MPRLEDERGVSGLGNASTEIKEDKIASPAETSVQADAVVEAQDSTESVLHEVDVQTDGLLAETAVQTMPEADDGAGLYLGEWQQTLGVIYSGLDAQLGPVVFEAIEACELEIGRRQDMSMSMEVCS